MNTLLKRTSLGLALFLGANVAMAECGTVQIAAMNWASAQLMASVDKIILEQGYGCSVELVPGDTMPTFTLPEREGRTGRCAGALDQRGARAAEDGA